jgi:hypothetical protein
MRYGLVSKTFGHLDGKSGGKPTFLTLSFSSLAMLPNLSGFQSRRDARQDNLEVQKAGLPPLFP